MISFKEFITEAFEVAPRNQHSKEVSLFLGRMQPIHKGHQAIIASMKNPIVLLVKGQSSSADKAKNPFDAAYQEKLIKKLNRHVDVRVISTGYIPDVAATLREEGKEVTAVYAGEDRINSYSNQFSRLNLDKEHAFHIVFHTTPRIVSATQVRTAIKNDDHEAFKQYMPKELWGEWEVMKKKLS